MRKMRAVLQVAIMLAAGIAQAQKTGAIDKIEIAGRPDAVRNMNGMDVYLVTLAEPKQRQKCHVVVDNEQQIECSRHFGKRPKIYQRSDLLAALKPPVRDHGWLWCAIPLSMGGGTIWGAVALSSITVVGAVPVAMIGGVVVLVAGVCAAFSIGEGISEKVLYLKPGETLPFALRN